MKLVDLTCTRCGATLKVNSSLTKCMCQYCGNEMLIDQEVQKHKFINGYEFGYQAELGRQQAILEAEQQRIIEDRNRLINTPIAYTYRNYVEKQNKRKLSDAEYELLMRDLMLRNKDLKMQYEKGITYQQPVQQARVENSTADGDGTDLLLGTCLQFFFCAGILSPFLIYYGNKMNKKHVELHGKTAEFITIANIINIVISGIIMLMIILLLIHGATNINSRTDTNDISNSIKQVEEIPEDKVNIQQNKYMDNEYLEEPVNLDEVNYAEDETLSGRVGACLADALNLRLKGKMSEDDYIKYKNSVLELEMKILSCATYGEDDSVYEQDVVNAENYLKQYQTEIH